jgi:hypothetical protein
MMKSILKSFDLLPSNVFQYIQEFLFDSWDYRFTKKHQTTGERYWKSFLNLNKFLFNSQIRKETIFIQLNKLYSIVYLQSSEFRERVHSRVAFSRYQIGLFLDNNKLLKLRDQFETIFQQDIHYLRIECSNVKDKDLWFVRKSVFYLDVHSCKDLRNLSSLIPAPSASSMQVLNQRNLNLSSSSSSPFSISIISELHTLIISDCPGLNIIPSLPNLVKLSISNCYHFALNLITKSYFPSLEDLAMKDQRITVDFLEAVIFVSKLSLNSPGVKDLSCFERPSSRIRTLDISFCLQLASIPEGLSVISLSLSQCSLVSSISHLSSLQKLSLHCCNNIENINFASLVSLQYLEISYCQKISSIFIQSWKEEQKLISLKLSNCFRLYKIDLYHDISYVDIDLCSKLKFITIEKSNRVYFLTIKNQLFDPLVTGKVTVLETL